MSDESEYIPPRVWVWDQESGGKFANINRPVAGATHDKDLPVGRHPLQLYSLATPNGVKVTVMLEELLALGHGGAEYDAWIIRIHDGDQFGSGFVGVNPNSKIPALVDHSGETPIRVFESGAILQYLSPPDGYSPIGGADKNLDYLEVVHVLIRRPRSGGKTVYKARKTSKCDHSAVGLSYKKLSQELV